MNCSSEGCGHPIEAHGDRAVFPPCEGTHWPGKPLLQEHTEGGASFWSVRSLWRVSEDPCPCRGFCG